MPTSWINTKTLQVDGDTGLTASQPAANTVKIGIDLSAADKQILFWGTAATQFQGSPNLTYDSVANNLILGAATKLAFSTDLFLMRDAANALAQRNGITGQNLRIYNTYTSGTIFERLDIGWVANVATIRSLQAGATARNLTLHAAGNTLNLGDTLTNRWQIVSGVFRPATDASLDIGTSTSRARSLYLGGAAASTALTIKQGATPTATPFYLMDSGNFILARITPEGNFLSNGGTLSNPGMGWSNDYDGNGTGFYRPSANQIGVTLNGQGNFLFNGTVFSPVTTGVSDLGSNTLPFGNLWVNTGNVNTALKLASAAYLAWNTDTYLYRDGAANTLAQRNGVNAQTFNIYNTYTSSTNFEGASLSWSGAVFNIATQKGSGGGTLQSMNVKAYETNFFSGDPLVIRWAIYNTGEFYPAADATYDLGFNNARIRTGYFGGAAASIPLVVKANAAQTADLQEFQDSSAVPKLYVTKDFDLVFANAGHGLPYGSCWGNDIAWTQASAVQNTWYAVSDTDMTDGQLNFVTHDGSGQLTVSKAGKYLVNYQICLESSVNNEHIETGIDVSGTVANDGRNHFHVVTANAEMPIGSTAILSLAASATVQIAVRTPDAGTPNLTVQHANLSIVQVGG